MWKQISNNYVPCFNLIIFAVVHSYTELLWFKKKLYRPWFVASLIVQSRAAKLFEVMPLKLWRLSWKIKPLRAYLSLLLWRYERLLKLLILSWMLSRHLIFSHWWMIWLVGILLKSKRVCIILTLKVQSCKLKKRW